MDRGSSCTSHGFLSLHCFPCRIGYVIAVTQMIADVSSTAFASGGGTTQGAASTSLAMPVILSSSAERVIIAIYVPKWQLPTSRSFQVAQSKRAADSRTQAAERAFFRDISVAPRDGRAVHAPIAFAAVDGVGGVSPYKWLQQCILSRTIVLTGIHSNATN